MVACFSFVFFSVVENNMEKQQFKIISVLSPDVYSLTAHVSF